MKSDGVATRSIPGVDQLVVVHVAQEHNMSHAALVGPQMRLLQSSSHLHAIGLIRLKYMIHLLHVL